MAALDVCLIGEVDDSAVFIGIGDVLEFVIGLPYDVVAPSKVMPVVTVPRLTLYFEMGNPILCFSFFVGNL